MALPQFRVGQGTPWAPQEAIRNLLDRMGEFSQRIGMMAANLHHVNDSLQRLAGLFGRFTAALMLQVGAPRVLRSDLYHTLVHRSGMKGRTPQDQKIFAGLRSSEEGGEEGSSQKSRFPGWSKVLEDQRKYIEEVTQIRLRAMERLQEKKIQNILEIKKTLRGKAGIDTDLESVEQSSLPVPNKIAELKRIIAEKQGHLLSAEKTLFEAQAGSKVLSPEGKAQTEGLATAYRKEISDLEAKLLVYEKKEANKPTPESQVIGRKGFVVIDTETAGPRGVDVNDPSYAKGAKVVTISAAAFDENNKLLEKLAYHLDFDPFSHGLPTEEKFDDMRKEWLAGPHVSPEVVAELVKAFRRRYPDYEVVGQKPEFDKTVLTNEVNKSLGEPLAQLIEDLQRDIRDVAGMVGFPKGQRSMESLTKYLGISYAGAHTSEDASIEGQVYAALKEMILKGEKYGDVLPASAASHHQIKLGGYGNLKTGMAGPAFPNMGDGPLDSIYRTVLGKYLAGLPKGSFFKNALSGKGPGILGSVGNLLSEAGSGAMNSLRGASSGAMNILEEFVVPIRQQLLKGLSAALSGGKSFSSKMLSTSSLPIGLITDFTTGLIKGFGELFMSGMKGVTTLTSPVFRFLKPYVSSATQFLRNSVGYLVVNALGGLRAIAPRVASWFGSGGGGSGGKGTGFFGDEESRKKLWAELEEATNKLTSAFMGLSAISAGLLRSASPDLFATFTLSLQILAASIGDSLIPVFVKLVGYVQDTAAWFLSLSDKTKTVIGNVAETALVFTGIVTAGRMLVTMFTGLNGKISLLSVGLVALTDMLLNMKDIHEQHKEARKVFEEATKGTGVTLEDIKTQFGSSPAVKALLEGKEIPEEQRKELSRKFAELAEEEKGKGGGFLKEKERLNPTAPAGALKWLNKYGLDEAFKPGTTANRIFKMFGGPVAPRIMEGLPSGEMKEEERKRYEKGALEKGKSSGVAKVLSEIFGGTRDLSSIRPKGQERADIAQQMLYTIQSLRVTPKYQAVDEAYRNIQIEALGKSPLEQILERIVQNNLVKMLEVMGEQLGESKLLNETLQGMGLNR